MTKTITFPENQELKEGDWVHDVLCGTKHKVSEVDKLDEQAYIEGRFWICSDGRSTAEHKNPRFIKCDPPKVKKKVKVNAIASVRTDSLEVIDVGMRFLVDGPSVVAIPFETEIEIEVDA